jgi:hypothetical protein
MALGPGKYDAVCTAARERAKSLGAVLIILSGEFGNGFSVQAPPEFTAHLPAVLRSMADEIERSFPKA